MILNAFSKKWVTFAMSDRLHVCFFYVEPSTCQTLVFTRIVYGSGQNNECLPGYLHSFILFGLDKMHVLSTSANFGEDVGTFNERFTEQRNKRR